MKSKDNHILIHYHIDIDHIQLILAIKNNYQQPKKHNQNQNPDLKSIQLDFKFLNQTNH